MAIKTKTQGTLPAVDLNYLQFSEFHMVVGENSPYNIAISAKNRPYGVVGNVKYYAKDNLPNMTIPNLDAFISTKVVSARQLEAVQALQKVQEGLGVLASIYYGIDFVGVE